MNLDQLWADATAELKASLTTTQIQQSMTANVEALERLNEVKV